MRSEAERFMRLCLRLALNGRGYVSPNPLVGAVIVKEGRIIAKGYHPAFGKPHAEAIAIEKAGESAKGSTLYVNLEPCCHYGKTPPCTKAIINAGIKRVVVAMRDPNPLVDGKGIEELRSNGIEVVVGVLEEEARKLNEAYIKFITTKLPFVVLKMAQSLDGKIATSKGESKWITGEKARDLVHQLRATYDAVLVGAQTVLTDDPGLKAYGKGRNPMRIVIDGRGKVPPSAKVFEEDAPRIVLTSQASSLKWRKELERKGVEVLIAGEERVEIDQALRLLGERNISSILVEGGGETSASFLEAGAVDKILFFIAPKIIGGRDAKTSVEGRGCQSLKNVIRFNKFTLKRIGEDLLVEAYPERGEGCSRE